MELGEERYGGGRVGRRSGLGGQYAKVGKGDDCSPMSLDR